MNDLEKARRLQDMAKSIPSHAKPRMLKWARESLRLSIEEVALAEKIEPSDLEAWERGDGGPSLAKLRSLARRYKRPLMVFYLPEPPKKFSVVRDFRSKKVRSDRGFSYELTIAIQRAQQLQAWAENSLVDEGADPIEIVGSHSRSDDPVEVGRELRGRLGVTVLMQSTCTYDSHAFQLWRTKCEDEGVFVFQASGVPVDEMRGFALSNSLAPTIVINGRDAYTARMFTLIHELAHIVIGETGVSGSGQFLFDSADKSEVERFCNQVAAETLVPEDDFRARIPSDWTDREGDAIRELAKTYRVSRAVIVYRLVNTGIADKKLVNRNLHLFTPPARKRSGSGPAQHMLAVYRYGELFARLAMSAYRDGSIHGGELSSLLNMKLKHLPSLEATLFPTFIQSSA